MISNASLDLIDTQRFTAPIRHSGGSNYFDIKGLAAIAKRDAENSSEGNKAALHKIGGQFESMLLQQMLKTMRSATNTLFKDSFFSTHRVKFYQDMLDSQLMQDVVQRNSIGLSEQFINNLSKDFDAEDSVIDLPRAEASSSDAPSLKPVNAESIALIRDASVRAADETRSSAINNTLILDVAQMTQVANTLPVAYHTDNHKDTEPSQAAVLNASRIEGSKDEETSDFQDRALKFVRDVLPAALPVAQQLGLKVSQLLAQTVLETGWGRHVIQGATGDSSFNLFGIKAGEDWQGEVARTVTTEYIDGSAIKVTADFRHYASYEESFADFLQFVTSKQRYADVLDQPPENFYFALQSAGYATDPKYADKIYDIAARIESQILPKFTHADSNNAPGRR